MNEEKDFFSYSSHNENENTEEVSLDLNSFSTEEESKKEKSGKYRFFKKRNKKQIIKLCITVFLIMVISVGLIAGGFVAYVFATVDGKIDQDLNDLKLNFTTTVYAKDSTGNWKEYQRLHGEFNRIWVPYNQESAESKDESYEGIPQNLVNAFVAIEDKRFFSHPGVDWKRTVKAFLNMALHSNTSYGGSTITQQLVKNIMSDREKTASRKVREIMRARYIESTYSKETIMECYLNTIALGHGMYGVEVASNYYFGKSAKDLSILECATLASITKSPSVYSPDDNPDNNKARREVVLREMKNQGYITEKEYEDALKEELKIVASKEAISESEVNSYYVEALIREVTKDLAESLSITEEEALTKFYNGGYKVYSNLNPEIQTDIDSVFNDESYALKAKDGKTLQGSFTIMDYKGNVVGLAGGIGKKTVNLGTKGLNRATDAIRQPGSTMKPIAAYAPAIEKGLINYSTVLEDKATAYTKGWTPKNWYNYYSGKTTVKFALERSMNTIPVYIVDKLTPQVCFDFLTQKMGITTLNSPDASSLSALGMGGTNGGITSLESAAAFAVFGNKGLYYKPTFYSKVCDQYDNVVLEKKVKPTVAVGEDTATIMNKLLQNVIYGSQGTGKDAQNYIKNMKFYAKTGTTNDQNDLWFVGGTPYYVASCWCGYDTQQGISTSTIALRMWGAVMGKIHEGLEPKEFTDSSYVHKRYYCTSSGLLATNACPSKDIGWYTENNLPESCNEHAGDVLDAPQEEKTEQTAEKKE